VAVVVVELGHGAAMFAVHEGALVDKDDDLWRAGTVGGAPLAR